MSGDAMDVLFLDIDGVLNAHVAAQNGFCGIDPWCVMRLNMLLDQFPELKLVITSSWRYMILSGEMTLRGFEILLQTHGVKCYERVVGFTSPDEQRPDGPVDPNIETAERSQQILEWVEKYGPSRFAVVDDSPISVPNFVQIGDHGLTDGDIVLVAGIFQ